MNRHIKQKLHSDTFHQLNYYVFRLEIKQNASKPKTGILHLIYLSELNQKKDSIILHHEDHDNWRIFKKSGEEGGTTLYLRTFRLTFKTLNP